ncbi:hypothetical protein Q5752_006364 [Cryptotrichosporon argae]
MRADPAAQVHSVPAGDRPFDPSASTSSSSSASVPQGGPAYPTLAYPSLAQPGPSYPPPPPAQPWYPPHHPAALHGPGLAHQHQHHAPPPHAHAHAHTHAQQPAPFYSNQQPYRPYFGYNQYAAPAYAPYYGYGGPGPASVQNGYYSNDAYRGQYFEAPRDEAGASVSVNVKYDEVAQAGAAGAGAGAEYQAPQGQFTFHPAASFPPNHPYAYGSGLGYNQFNPAYGYAEFPPPPPPELNGGPAPHLPPGPPAPAPVPAAPVSKGLNPAAQGFTYVPPERREPRPNGHTIPDVGNGGESGGLGLSQMDRAEPVVPSPVEPEREETDSKPNGLPNGHHDEVDPEPAQETLATAPEPDVTPKAATPPLPSPIQTGLRFTGSSLPDVLSPPSKASSSLVSSFRGLVLHVSRPDAMTTGNSYSQRLASAIPASVDTETEEGSAAPGAPRAHRGRPRPRARAVFKTGRNVPTTLTFGEAETLVVPPPTSRVKAASASLAPPPTIFTPAPVAPTPRVVSSWAALFDSSARKSTSHTPEPLSSPAKSLASLPREDPTTPRSTAPSLPPSTPQPSAPKPFNYAAAAATGTSSPQDEMARLLEQGVRGRKDATVSVPRGLINTGNMCFANTILQVLVYCAPFTELFEELGKRLRADLARRTPLIEAMIIFLREFQPSPSANSTSPGAVSGANGASMPKGKGKDVARKEAFVPENVYDAMRENKRFDSMRRGHQEDAEEYLGFFLDTLHEELLLLKSRLAPASGSSASRPADADQVVTRPVSPSVAGQADSWLEVGPKRKTHVVRADERRDSAVSRLFGGKLRSVLHTPGQKDSVTIEPYQPLQVDIDDPSVRTLADALKAISRPETVPVHSAARGGTVDATKQVYVEAFPTVLILHLKRFVYDAQERAVVKRSKPVSYGVELVVPQDIVSPAQRAQGPVKYRLFGVVYHHGPSASGGHYTVAVARQDNTGWLHFDDEAVNAVPAEQVVVSDDEAEQGKAGAVGGRERVAYLLFYQRVRLSPIRAAPTDMQITPEQPAALRARMGQPGSGGAYRAPTPGRMGMGVPGVQRPVSFTPSGTNTPRTFSAAPSSGASAASSGAGALPTTREGLMDMLNRMSPERRAQVLAQAQAGLRAGGLGSSVGSGGGLAGSSGQFGARSTSAASLEARARAAAEARQEEERRGVETAKIAAAVRGALERREATTSTSAAAASSASTAGRPQPIFPAPAQHPHAPSGPQSTSGRPSRPRSFAHRIGPPKSSWLSRDDWTDLQARLDDIAYRIKRLSVEDVLDDDCEASTGAPFSGPTDGPSEKSRGKPPARFARPGEGEDTEVYSVTSD